MRTKRLIIWYSTLVFGCALPGRPGVARELAPPLKEKKESVVRKTEVPAIPAVSPDAISPRNTPARPLNRSWVVLPDETRPCLAPSPQAERDARSLRYPARIEEIRRIVAEKANAEKTDWIEFQGNDGKKLFLQAALLAPETPLSPKGRNLPIGRERVDINTALPLDYSPDDLVLLPPKWNYAKDGKVRLRKEAVKAAERMFEAARREKIHLRAVSGYRSAETQRKLYLKKIEKEGLGQNVVAKPGHSEHQLGTALDVSGLDPKTVLTASFGETPEGRWLRENVARFGFRISYTVENRRETGYTPEPWHLRYMGSELK